jgi:hypothetical protein
MIFIFFLSFLVYLSRPVSVSEVIFVPQGSTLAIISYLSEKNTDANKIDAVILRTMGRVQAGWIDLGAAKLSKLDFLYKLTTAKAALTQITLIPGETTAVFLQEVAKKLNLSEAKLNEFYSKFAPLEDGFLVPETYKVPLGINEEQLAAHLVNLSKKSHEKTATELLGNYDEKRWSEYLVTASVVQKEAANEDEMPLVASVIQNRLKKGMKLQMDGTLNYGLHSHETVTAERIRSDKSKFNTYLNEGLPPSPVCTVGLAAIKAAIRPAQSEFLYFVRDKKTGKHKFSVTYDEHVGAINSQK